MSSPSTLSSLPSRSFPTELSPTYFPRFPFRPSCRRFHLLPYLLNGALPKLFPTASPLHPVVASISLLPNSYFPQFPLGPPCRCFRFAPSQRSSPQAISDVQHVVAEFPVRPPCRRFHLAPSPRSSPKAISHGFPSVHTLVASVSLPCGKSTKREPKHWRCFWEENREKKESKDVADIETPRTQKHFPCMSHCPAFGINFTSLIGSHFFGTVAFMELVLKTWCQKLCIFVSLAPYAALPQLFPRLGPTFFRTIALIEIVPKNPCHPPSPRSSGASIALPPAELPHCPGAPTVLSPSYFPRVSLPPNAALPKAISHGFPSVHLLVASVSLLPNGALPKLFPTVPFPSTLLSLPYRSFPSELSPKYFPRLPFRPPSRRFRIAPSQRSSPHAISHGLPPSTLSSLPSGSFPTELSPSYFPRFPLCSPLPTELSPSFFPRFPLRPPSRHFRIAPSRQV